MQNTNKAPMETRPYKALLTSSAPHTVTTKIRKVNISPEVSIPNIVAKDGTKISIARLGYSP